MTADTSIDDLVVENNASGGISILTPNSATAQIAFGDPEDNNVSRFIYNHSNNYLAAHANGAEVMRFDSSGNLGLGTVSPSARLHIFQSGQAGQIIETGSNGAGAFAFTSFRSGD